MATARSNLIVIGNGMVGHRLVESLIDRGAADRWNITVFGEEPRLAYDRVHLSEWFAGKTAEDLALADADRYRDDGIVAHVGDRVVEIDRAGQVVRSASGRLQSYDALVLATGSAPFVPPIPGHDADHCFVYRTIEDLEALGRFAAGGRTRGAVIGGGLLGLEAANALRTLGLETHVVEIAPRLMALQVDDAGGAILRRRIEELGIGVHTATATAAIEPDRLRCDDGSELEVDLVVFSAGIRPRDELARACGLDLGPRGGVRIDDECRTSDPAIYAVGECAAWRGSVFGLVAPGYEMADVAAAGIAGAGGLAFGGADMSSKLKLLGVDVVSLGDAHGRSDGSRSFAFTDEVRGVYKKIVLDADADRLIGAVLVGDASDYMLLQQIMQGVAPLPASPERLVMPVCDAARPVVGGPETLPDEAQICKCANVTKAALCSCIRGGVTTVGELRSTTRAGTGCGGCMPLMARLLQHELAAQGVAVSDHLCEHFPYTRQQLYHIVSTRQVTSFDRLLESHGRGRGCEVCKPAIAGILASCWNEHILGPGRAGLQDTNDYLLANMQRDGTYSVVPRVPGGEITPDKLIAIGAVAKKYDLYTKITGAQRVDMFGARQHELPLIWRELIDAGFETGHAYGKSLRAVKTCVGSTWCRYGVQDSVALGIGMEHRYKGLRAPHKIKMAVSGCARECAEAQGKDVGVIATEVGYNLYVGGNGGMNPRHAELLAADLDERTLVRYIDRFLMFYIRTADKLQRTARWLELLEGGIDYLREVIIDDRLGICAELEDQMGHIVGTYRCEWKAALEDDEIMRRFQTFVNAPGEAASDLVYVRERGQRRPAPARER